LIDFVSFKKFKSSNLSIPELANPNRPTWTTDAWGPNISLDDIMNSAAWLSSMKEF
jgi:hypothetical protein